MSRMGFIAIILGLIMLIGKYLYLMLLALDLPLYNRLAVLLIFVGCILIVIKQIFQRIHEKKESDAYKDL